MLNSAFFCGACQGADFNGTSNAPAKQKSADIGDGMASTASSGTAASSAAVSIAPPAGAGPSPKVVAAPTAPTAPPAPTAVVYALPPAADLPPVGKVGACKVTTGTQCFWKQTSNDLDCWYPAPWLATQAACVQQDSCYGGGGASHGGCYKWAASSDAAVAAVTQPAPGIFGL